MTEPSPPLVCGPLSRYSTKVRIQGMEPGSKVQIYANNTQPLLVAPEVATSADQWFSVPALVPGWRIKAAQFHPTLGKSAVTPDLYAVTVMAEPTSSNDIAALSLVSHTYHCARCIWLDGAYPGAIVTLTDASKSFRGSTVCLDADARIVLAPPLGFSDALAHANMIVGPFSKNDAVQFTPYESPIQSPTGRVGALPIPVITDTIFPCQTSLPINGAVDGAIVMVRRYGTVQTISGPKYGLRSVSSECFDVPGLWFPLPTPVAPDDEFTVQQHMPSCNLVGAIGPTYTVSPDPPPPPLIEGILCKADVQIRVSGVRPGARVEFAEGSASVPFVVAGAWADACTFLVPPGALAKLDSVKVRQVLQCAGLNPLSSDWSAPIPVDDLSAFDDGRLPQIYPQPRACGMIVRVRNALPGSTIYIVSEKWSVVANSPVRIGGPAVVPLGGKAEVDVTLSYPLFAGDQIWAEQIFCGASRAGDKVTVLGVVPDEIGAPIIDDPVPDCGSVAVRNVIPGCRVDLYTVNAANTKTFAATRMTPLNVAYFEVPRVTYNPPGPVRLVARQRACGRVSQWSNVASVVPGKVKVLEVHRLCQLTGESDADPSMPHFTRTWTEYGITGTDLGIPVEHNGSLYLYFGDTGGSLNDPLVADKYGWPIPDSYAGCFKSLAIATPEVRVSIPEPLAGLRLNMVTQYTTPLLLPPMNVAGHDARVNRVVSDNPDLGICFNVPTGGFSFDGAVYLFVGSGYPDSKVTIGPHGMEDEMAQSFLLRSEGSTYEFKDQYLVDDWLHDFKFINICPVVFNSADWPELNAPSGLALLIYGSGQYRSSDVFLALAPLSQGKQPPLPPPEEWNYFTGLSAKGPEFTKGGRAQALSLLGMEDDHPPHNVSHAVTDNRNNNNRVGEFSVSWVSGLNHWLLLWGGIGAAVSRTPWGPWVRLGYDFVTDPLAGNPNRPERNVGVVPAEWLVPDTVSHRVEGVPYGPGYGAYALQRYFRWNPEEGVATVYALVSFAPQGPPSGGTVHLVRMDLGCEP